MRLGLAVAAVALCACSARSLVLTDEGRSEFVIVVPDEASAPVLTAARELQAHLQAVTGALLPVQKESQTPKESPQIVVGAGPRFRETFPEFDLGRLKHDGIAMKTAGSSLFLAGDEPRGTLYAVYTFLEDVVGCRWWTSRESFAPKRPTLEVPSLDTVHVPRLRSREAFYRDTLDGVFAARMKLNGHFPGVTPEYGGHHTILGWCHTFYQLLPPEKYFAAHPDWYSEVGGKRVGENAQLCLTNDEMRAELLKNALEWLRSRGDASADIISISQNDCAGRCECAACRAVEAEEGAASGPVIRFVNAVAEAIEDEFPDVLVETLAYQYTREAPKVVRPRRNVVVRLCTIECSYAQPLETGPQNASFRRDIDAWSAVAPQLYVWDYVTNFKNYLFPHPNLRVLAPNVRFFADRKAVGLFEQGDIGSSCGDFVELRAWLLAHLMWDPSRDEKALVSEFLQGYYGPAAEPIRAYLDLTHDAVEASGIPLGCYMDDTAGWLGLDELGRATALFDEAQRRVADQPELAARVRRARLPLDHVWLSRYYKLRRLARAQGKPFEGPADPVAACEEFIQTARRFDCGQYREGGPFADYEAILRDRLRRQGTPPELCKGLDEAQWVDVQDNEFLLYRPASIADDAAASDGKAARMPADHTQWAVQFPLTNDVTALGPLHCYVAARCEATAAEGAAFDFGIYDTVAGAARVTKTASLPEAGGSQYRVLDLGVHALTPGAYVWVAPKANPDAVSAVWVDRVFFVREK